MAVSGPKSDPYFNHVRTAKEPYKDAVGHNGV